MTAPETPESAAAGKDTAAFGVGPWFAMLQSMVAENQANGLMYYNAVANQQMGNIIGMVATMNCVQALLGKDGLVPLSLPKTTGAADAEPLVAHLERLGELQHRHALQTIQRAGTSLCVAGIAREPDKAQSYTQAIEQLRRMLD